MNSDELRTEALYLTTMSMLKKMYADGLITAEEYGEAETLFLEKYDPLTGTLFSSLSLT